MLEGMCTVGCTPLLRLFLQSLDTVDEARSTTPETYRYSSQTKVLRG